jgi:hypothetical protein
MKGFIMDRKDFTKKLVMLGICPLLFSDFTFTENEDDKTKSELKFIQNWLSDLLDSMDNVIDRETQVKIVEGCGRGCYNRYKFKQDIAEKGKNDIDKLIEAYSQNFEIWRDKDEVHIRYGEISTGCYCPAAKYRIPKTNDLHCECTRTTHQTIFQNALGKNIKVKILDTVRRGGKTCHFVVYLS